MVVLWFFFGGVEEVGVEELLIDEKLFMFKKILG